MVSSRYLQDLIAPLRRLPLLPVLNHWQISQSSQYRKKAKEPYLLLKSQFIPKAKGLITVYGTLHPDEVDLLITDLKITALHTAQERVKLRLAEPDAVHQAAKNLSRAMDMAIHDLSQGFFNQITNGGITKSIPNSNVDLSKGQKFTEHNFELRTPYTAVCTLVHDCF